MKKVVFTVCVLLAVAVLFIIACNVIALFPTRLNETDLQYVPREIASNRNAYPVLLLALKKLKEHGASDQMLPFLERESYIDFNKHQEALKGNMQFLEVFDKAMILDNLRMPTRQQHPTTDDILGYIKELELIGIFQYSRIKLLFREGQLTNAFEEAEKLFKYGYLLQNSGRDLLHVIYGMRLKIRALEITKELCDAKVADRMVYIGAIKNMQKYADNATGLTESLSIEYTANTSGLRNLTENVLQGKSEYQALLNEYKKNPWKLRWLYNENATINEIGNYYRQEINNITGKYSSIKHGTVYFDLINKTPSCLMRISGNPIGKVLSQVGLPKLDNIVRDKFELDAKTNLTILLLAMRAYYTDNKTLPTQLNDLLPNYLASIPEDSFDNKLLKYVQSQKIIYSVGPDMKDNHGDKEKDIVLDLNLIGR
jgi:hypothetical protein